MAIAYNVATPVPVAVPMPTLIPVALGGFRGFTTENTRIWEEENGGREGWGRSRGEGMGVDLTKTYACMKFSNNERMGSH